MRRPAVLALALALLVPVSAGSASPADPPPVVVARGVDPGWEPDSTAFEIRAEAVVGGSVTAPPWTDTDTTDFFAPYPMSYPTPIAVRTDAATISGIAGTVADIRSIDDVDTVWCTDVPAHYRRVRSWTYDDAQTAEYETRFHQPYARQTDEITEYDFTIPSIEIRLLVGGAGTVTGSSGLPSTITTTEFGAVAPAPPEGLRATGDPTKPRVVLDWLPSAGARGYRIERREVVPVFAKALRDGDDELATARSRDRREASDLWETIADIGLAKSWTDRKVVPGQPYEYRIAARIASAVGGWSGTNDAMARGTVPKPDFQQWCGTWLLTSHFDRPMKVWPAAKAGRVEMDASSDTVRLRSLPGKPLKVSSAPSTLTGWVEFGDPGEAHTARIRFDPARTDPYSGSYEVATGAVTAADGVSPLTARFDGAAPVEEPPLCRVGVLVGQGKRTLQIDGGERVVFVVDVICSGPATLKGGRVRASLHVQNGNIVGVTPERESLPVMSDDHWATFDVMDLGPRLGGDTKGLVPYRERFVAIVEADQLPGEELRLFAGVEEVGAAQFPGLVLGPNRLLEVKIRRPL